MPSPRKRHLAPRKRRQLTKAEQITAPITDHGEGAAYSASWGGARFVDMLRGDVLALDDAGKITRRHVASIASFVRPRTNGGWVVMTERALALSDGPGLFSPLEVQPEMWHEEHVRSNEGTCTPDGQLLIGAMAYDQRPNGGFLAVAQSAQSLYRTISSATVSNGIAFTSDGRRAYYADTATGRIDVFDWSSPEGLTRRRPWVHAPDGAGGYDGLATDAADGVWVALFGGSAIHHYGPSGELEDLIELPVSQPTSVAFVRGRQPGLLITTSRYGLNPRDEPAAGALFFVDLSHSISGAPLHTFAA